MISEGTPVEAVTKDQIRLVTNAVREYRLNAKLSTEKIGRGVGYASSVISQFLHGKYPGDVRQVAIDLDRWLEDQLKRDAAPRATDYVPTQVALEIRTVADAAIQLGTIGLVYGPETSGIGKTMALKAIHQEKPASLLITVEKVSANPTGLLWAMCAALRIGMGGNNRVMYERIKTILRGSNRLMMVDQAHNLCGSKDDKAFFMLCDLHDATGAPQLWAGTQDIVAYLSRGQAKGKETLAQIRRRIGIRRDLMERTRGGGDGGKGQPLYSIEEIRKVFARNRMRLTPDATRYLWMLACLPDGGALGTCKNVVVIATTVGELKGAAALTADMLRAAHRELVSGPTFQLLERQMEDYQPVMKVG
jgi:DNA transposition AAA+ family ATPase